MGSSKRFTLLVIVTLVVLNVASIGTLWWLNSGPNPAPPPSPKGLYGQLGWSEDQISQYEKMRDQHRQEMRGILQKEGDLRAELVTAITEGDSTRGAAIAAELGASKAKLDLEFFRYFSKVRTICTEEQLPKFDRFLKELGNQMTPPHPGVHVQGGGKRHLPHRGPKHH